MLGDHSVVRRIKIQVLDARVNAKYHAHVHAKLLQSLGDGAALVVLHYQLRQDWRSYRTKAEALLREAQRRLKPRVHDARLEELLATRAGIELHEEKPDLGLLLECKREVLVELHPEDFAGRQVVLVLAASPGDHPELAIAEEMRVIEEELDMRRFRVVPGWSVTVEQALSLIEEHRPVIVHFVGHADPHALMLMSKNKKKAARLSYAEFVDNLRHRPRCLILNACVSGSATDLTRSIDLVIGMRARVTDEVGRLFARSFYGGLDGTQSVQAVFAAACAALGLKEAGLASIPQLCPRAHVDPATIVL